jgi:dihydroorotase
VKYLLKGVSILGGAPTDLLITDGVVAALGRDARLTGAEVVDADGLVALPGLVDLHTHLREPGREDAETVESGSRAAALGGYTAVCAMPNTDPVADTAGVVEQVWRLGRTAGLVEVQPVGAVTIGLRGEHLAELGAMATSAARVRIFSDDGHCVTDARVMRRALEYVKAFDGVVAQHAEEARLTQPSDPVQAAQMHEGEVSARLGLTGWPAVAEEAIIARDALLAGHVGARLHVCHVSTAGSIEIIRWAKRRGIRITAEVTPHHLLLTDARAESYDPVCKVNPPLRTAEDVAALRAALAEGAIDVVATDHAPHAVEDKECEWVYARPGMLGLETALSVVLSTGVFDRSEGADPAGTAKPAGGAVRTAAARSGGAGRAGGARSSIDWEGVAERMSRTPARIAGLSGHGRDPAPGAPANLALVDPAASWVVDPAALASRSRNTPYTGMRLPGRVVATFLQGRATVLDGKAVL